MGFLMRMVLRLQTYISQKRIPIECKTCGKAVVPRKEISVLNIIAFVIIGVIVFFVTKRKIAILLPLVLSVINSLAVKKKCPECKGIEF